VPPVVVSATLDLHRQELEVTFDEIVVVASIKTSSLALGAQAESAVSLTGSVAATDDVYALVVTLTLSKTAYDNIMAQEFACTEPGNCQMFIDGGAFTDASNALNMVADGTAPVVKVIEDEVVPVYQQFDAIDMDAGIMNLTFSESVNASSFVAERFILTSYYKDPAALYALTDAAIVSPHGPSVTVQISADDMLTIKYLDLCNDPTDCYSRVERGVATDMFDNQVLATSEPERKGLLPEVFVADSVGPTAVAFSFDASAELLNITFSEPINPTSFEPAGVFFQSAKNVSNGQSVQLTAASHALLQLNQGRLLVVRVGSADLHRMKLLGIAGTAATTFLALSDAAIQDVAGNWNDPIPASAALAVNDDEFSGDVVPPQLRQFVLNLETNSILFIWDETVNTESMDCTKVHLNEYMGPATVDTSTAALCLSGSCTVIAESTTHVRVMLADEDVEIIETHSAIGTSAADTKITCATGTILDMAGRPSVEITPGDNFVATEVVPDLSLAQLESYTST
jgi:hypothetical protein